METKQKVNPKLLDKSEATNQPVTSYWSGLWILLVALVVTVCVCVCQCWNVIPEPSPILLVAKEELVEELKKLYKQLPKSIALPPMEELAEGLLQRDVIALSQIEQICRSLPESSELRKALQELLCRFVPEHTLCSETASYEPSAEDLFLKQDISEWTDRKKFFECIQEKTAFSKYITPILLRLKQSNTSVSLENFLREITKNVQNFILFRGIGAKTVWSTTNTVKEFAPNFYQEVWEPAFREWMENPLESIQKYSSTPILECWK